MSSAFDAQMKADFAGLLGESGEFTTPVRLHHRSGRSVATFASIAWDASLVAHDSGQARVGTATIPASASDAINDTIGRGDKLVVTETGEEIRIDNVIGCDAAAWHVAISSDHRVGG